MSDFYTDPTSSLNDDNKAKNRFSHSLIAAATTFFVIPGLIISFLYIVYRSIVPMDPLRSFLTSFVLAIVSGLIVLPFRTLRWYWAILAGIVLAPCLLIILSIIHDVLKWLT